MLDLFGLSSFGIGSHCSPFNTQRPGTLSFFMIVLQLVHIYRTLFCNDEGSFNSLNDINLFHTLPFIFYACVTDFLRNSLSQLMHS